MSKKVISILLCLSLFSSVMAFSANAVEAVEQNSLSVSVVEKDLETDIVAEKIYAQDGNGNTSIKVVDSWTDEEDVIETAVPASSLSVFTNTAANLLGVVGSEDGRTVVTNTRQFPYSAIVHLEIFFGLEVYRGTGFLISDRVVATAAHCLYDEELGWATSVTVRPGRDGASLPYGVATSRNVAVSTEYYESFDRNYDWGAIYLNLGIVNNPGSFSLTIAEDNNVNGYSAKISGYPKYVGSSTISTTKQYEMSGTVRTFNDYLFYYTIDTSGGQSGAPILNENNEVIGIHTFTNNNYMNYGVRITPQVSYYLNEYINDYSQFIN